MEDETEEVEQRDPVKWSWADFWSIISAGISAWFTLVGAMISDISDAIQSHGNYQRSRAEMAEQGAREMEALISAVERERADVNS